MQPDDAVVIMARGGLGDTVRFLPVLSLLRRHAGGGRVVCIVRDQTQGGIIKAAGLSDEIVVYDPFRLSFGAKLSFARWLRGCRARLFVATYENIGWRTKLLSLLSGIPVRVGYGPPPFFNRPLAYSPRRPRRELELDILRSLGIDIPHPLPPPRLEIPAAAERWAEEILGGPPGELLGDLPVGIHIGLDGVSHGKCWPVERYLELINRLHDDDPRLRFIVLGGKDELPLIAQLQSRGVPPRTEVLIGKTGLPEAAALVRRCRLVITNDSFFLHLAGAFHVPTVALFGPTEEHIVVSPQYVVEAVAGNCPRRPCYRIGPPGARRYDCGHYRCIKLIEVERVRRAAVKLLSGPAPADR